MPQERINQTIEAKAMELIKTIENEDEYFTNSKELTDLMHFTGLNIRHLGIVFQRARHSWLRRVLQGEIMARSLKNLYRFDIQNCVMVQSEKVSQRERQ